MLNLKEERKYSRLRKLGQELHVPIPEHFIECEVTDKNGKVIQHLKQRSHSWVRNAYNLLLSQMACKNLDSGVGEYGAGFLSIKSTAAAITRGDRGAIIVRENEENFETGGIDGGYRSLAANDSFGILVGSNAGAWSFEDYVLLTPITEGTGPGQLNHVAMAVPIRSYGALTWTITWVRYFNNNTLLVTDVLVNEVGLVAYGFAAFSDAYWVTSRDVLGATVTVPGTGQLKVTYTIEMVFPA